MNYRSFFYAISLCFMLFCLESKAFDVNSQTYNDTTIYLLTCSPGAEVYSAFGHSAILSSIGTKNDVYNYGTFNFNTDNFILKFARGKLPYALSVQDLGYFQLEYLYEKRQVLAQELALNSVEKKKLLNLLSENAKEQNRYYKYDFFYDNCATRLKDILDQSTEGKIDWNLKPNSTNYNFRELIDSYAGHLEWIELGIDLALGLPCDKIMEPGENCFLPDSLKQAFSQAVLHDSPLVKSEQEILPKEELKETKSWFQKPGLVLSVVAIIFSVILYRTRSSFTGRVLVKTLLGLNGVLGLLIFSLWFFTDHTATAFNLNLLWANPLNLVFIFLNSLTWWRVFFVINCITLITWSFVPQDLHEAVLPLIAVFMGATLTLILDIKSKRALV